MFHQPTLDPALLRAAMQAANLDPVELGQATDVRPGLIRRYLTGSVPATGSTTARLARVLGVSPLDLLTKHSD